MATPLDFGFLQNFGSIFTFILIFAVSYGIMSKVKIFGENKILQAIIAFCLALISMFSTIVVETISKAAPWFVLLMFAVFMILIGFMVLGVKEADIMSVLKSPDYHFISWSLYAVIIIIMLGSLGQVISEERGGLGPYSNVSKEEGKAESEFWNTILHPKVLGMVTVLLIAYFTISKLTAKST